MSILLQSLLYPYMAEVGEADTGAPADRGDDVATAAADTTPQASETVETKDDAEDTQPVDTKAEDEEEESPKPKKDIRIPKARFDEAVQKERAKAEAAMARLKEYEAKEAQSKLAADFTEANKQVKEMIKQHTSLLADGELDKASDLMEKILDMKDAIAEKKAEFKAVSAKDQTKEEIRYDAIVAKLEADYPQINPDAEEFDADTVKRVQAFMAGLMQVDRMSPSQALREAVSSLLGAPKTAKASDSTDQGMRRKEAAVKKALDAKTRQPASTAGVGLDHDKEGGPMDASAVMKLSWDEFIKLPESKLSELRGDHV